MFLLLWKHSEPGWCRDRTTTITSTHNPKHSWRLAQKYTLTHSYIKRWNGSFMRKRVNNSWFHIGAKFGLWLQSYFEWLIIATLTQQFVTDFKHWVITGCRISTKFSQSNNILSLSEQNWEGLHKEDKISAVLFHLDRAALNWGAYRMISQADVTVQFCWN